MPPRLARALKVLLVLAAAAPRVALAVADQGIVWPDEIYQSLEPAHRFAFGYGFVAWEFQRGARSWLFPGMLGSLWKAAALAGVSSSIAFILVAKLAVVALALAAVWGTIELAERLKGPQAALLAGLAAVTFPPSLLFSHRCMAEVASGAPIVFAALALIDRESARRALAGVLCGIAFLLRYQNGLLLIGFSSAFILERRYRDMALFFAMFSLVALMGGLLDWATWGTPFHSLVTYLQYNLIQGKASLYGTEPLTFYFTTFAAVTGIAWLPLGAGFLASARRAPALFGSCVLFIVAHTLIPHKELRFLLPIFPLALALSAAGLVELFELAGARLRAGVEEPSRRVTSWFAAAGVGAILLALMGTHAPWLTFADVGLKGRGPLRAEDSAWGALDPVNRLLWDAGARPDLCGLALVGMGTIWTGGFSYLHRDVPYFAVPLRPVALEQGLGRYATSANYAIAPEVLPELSGYRAIESRGAFTLLRRDGACGPPPAEATRLFH